MGYKSLWLMRAFLPHKYSSKLCSLVNSFREPRWRNDSSDRELDSGLPAKTRARFPSDRLGTTRWPAVVCAQPTRQLAREKRKKREQDKIIESAVKIIERKRASRCLPGRRGIQSRGTPAKNRDNGAHHERESAFLLPSLVLRYPYLHPSHGGSLHAAGALLVIRLMRTFVYDRANCNLPCTYLIMQQRTPSISSPGIPKSVRPAEFGWCPLLELLDP